MFWSYIKCSWHEYELKLHKNVFCVVLLKNMSDKNSIFILELLGDHEFLSQGNILNNATVNKL